MRKLVVFSFLLCLVAREGRSQGNFPYWKEVQALRQKDSLAFPAPGQTLFIGSSSFTLWKDVQDYFPKHKILNRAFGGSTLLDMIRYRYDVVFPYQPKQIVLYCGENDFAAADSITVEMVVERFKTLYSLVRARYPLVPFLYVSMKPSPSRVHLMPKYEAANQQIMDFLKKQKKSAFADVYSKMLNADGSPMEDLFIEDRLHMNAKGYAIWKKVLEKYLVP
ncbi:MAG: G-D-S-L family lipolytic protein [Sphingobacteriales bacterium]|nr:G-D-S-L family lipolytic protein [Sphingobacteriales bacterium]